MIVLSCPVPLRCCRLLALPGLNCQAAFRFCSTRSVYSLLLPICLTKAASPVLPTACPSLGALLALPTLLFPTALLYCCAAVLLLLSSHSPPYYFPPLLCCCAAVVLTLTPLPSKHFTYDNPMHREEDVSYGRRYGDIAQHYDDGGSR